MIEALSVDGTAVALERDASFKHIRLADDEEPIERNVEEAKGPVLRA